MCYCAYICIGNDGGKFVCSSISWKTSPRQFMERIEADPCSTQRTAASSKNFHSYFQRSWTHYFSWKTATTKKPCKLCGNELFSSYYGSSITSFVNELGGDLNIVSVYHSRHLLVNVTTEYFPVIKTVDE